MPKNDNGAEVRSREATSQTAARNRLRQHATYLPPASNRN